MKDTNYAPAYPSTEKNPGYLSPASWPVSFNSKDLDQAALVLAQAVRLLLDEAVPAADLRQQVLTRFGPDALREAADTVQELARPDEDPLVQALRTRYATVRRFLPAVLRGVVFEGTPAANCSMPSAFCRSRR